MNSRWKSTLAAFGAAGLTIAIAPLAVAESAVDEAPAAPSTATAPAVTQEPVPVAPSAPSSPAPTQSSPTTGTSGVDAPSSSVVQSASEAPSSAVETSPEESSSAENSVESSETESPESRMERNAGPEGEVLLLEEDIIDADSTPYLDGYIVEGNPEVGLERGDISEREYLDNPSIWDLPRLIQDPEWHFDWHGWYRYGYPTADPVVGEDWYWDNSEGEWVRDGAPDPDNPDHLSVQDMGYGDFLPGWYEHADGKWYPYPPYPGYPYSSWENGGRYVNVCAPGWRYTPPSGGGSGGSSVIIASWQVIPMAGPSTSRYQNPEASVFHDPCAPKPPAPEPPAEDPPTPEPPAEDPPVTETPTEHPPVEQPPVERVVERQRVVVAEQPAPQGPRGVAARTGEIVPVGIAVALLAAAGGGLAFLRRRNDK